MFSTLIRRTIVSMIATYGTMLFLSIITGFLFLIVMQLTMFSQIGTGMPPPSILGHILSVHQSGVLFASFLSPGMGDSISEMTKVKFPIWTVFYFLFYYGIVIIYCSEKITCKYETIKIKRRWANGKETGIEKVCDWLLFGFVLKRLIIRCKQGCLLPLSSPYLFLLLQDCLFFLIMDESRLSLQYCYLLRR